MQNSASSLGRETAGQNRERKAGDRSLFQENFHALQQYLQASSKNALATTENAILESLAQLEQNISSRCRTMGTVFSRPLSAGPAVELCNPDCVGADHLGPADAVTVPNQGSGTGDFKPECPAGTAGSAKCLTLEQLQGAGAVSGRRQNLSSDASGTADRPCGQGGPTGTLGKWCGGNT